MKEFALGFATHAHIKQKRKYTGEPYVVHCIAVARQMEELGFSEEVVSAALLHDTVEDTDTTIREIEETFGSIISKLVEELTDVFTIDKFPKLNRKERKKLECERLGAISSLAKSIKLADLIDNSRSIIQHDKGFARTYLSEKEALLNVFSDGDPRLMEKARLVLANAKNILKDTD